jgi:xanthine dehydrogenase iron-sulfur cluster and FAD-binding subunit A
MLVLVTALAAAAQAPAVQPSSADDPIICTRQNVGDEVGTRLQRKKICMRKSDRDCIKQQEKQAVQQLVNDGDARMVAPSGPPR